MRLQKEGKREPAERRQGLGPRRQFCVEKQRSSRRQSGGRRCPQTAFLKPLFCVIYSSQAVNVALGVSDAGLNHCSQCGRWVADSRTHCSLCSPIHLLLAALGPRSPLSGEMQAPLAHKSPICHTGVVA